MYKIVHLTYREVDKEDVKSLCELLKSVGIDSLAEESEADRECFLTLKWDDCVVKKKQPVEPDRKESLPTKL